jgi:hypothetical protein
LTTCNPSFLIGMNDLNGSVSIEENATQIDIKTLSESLSHGEIEEGQELFSTLYQGKPLRFWPATIHRVLSSDAMFVFRVCKFSFNCVPIRRWRGWRTLEFHEGNARVFNFGSNYHHFSMMLWHCSRSSGCETSRVDSQRWDCGEHAVAALLRWYIEDLIVVRLLRYIWCECARMVYRKTQWRIVYMWQIADCKLQIAEGRRLRSNGHWHKERRRQRTDWTMSRSC